MVRSEPRPALTDLELSIVSPFLPDSGEDALVRNDTHSRGRHASVQCSISVLGGKEILGSSLGTW